MTALLRRMLQNQNNNEALHGSENEIISSNDAALYVQSKMLEDKKHLVMLQKAMAGDKKAAFEVEKLIARILKEGHKTVKKMSLEEAAFEIYSATWGLGPVEQFYRDPEVNEIRVNSPIHVYIQRRGKNERVDVCFGDEKHVERVIKRMFMEDTGASLDRSNPILMSVRLDGSRLTATCPPVTKHWTFVLRKPHVFEMTLENLQKGGTLDEKTWKALTALVKGRANILFSGNPGAGKTSLLRELVGQWDKHLRILSIGEDLELHLGSYFPDRDIIELEEHKHVGATMRELFRAALREGPDVMIIEEFRGAGEAIEAVKACTRGLLGAMATAHFSTPEETVEGTAMMMIEEGLGLTLELAKLRVARAFNVVVQMLADTGRGIKKVISITEVVVSNGSISYNDLVRWQPDDEYDFWGSGQWEFCKRPSARLLSQLRREVARETLVDLGWEDK